jgi:pimeloyl-ACP methyl ester carboxylesterase
MPPSRDGDSYGTFFAQTFAGRHPERVRALVLDSAYPVIGQSPWYPEAAPVARQALEYACRRSPTCRNLPGTSLARLEALVERLRAHPFAGWAHDGDGVLRCTVADATTLAYLVFSNETNSVVYRELDPAARDYLEHGESAPLLRLLTENYDSPGFERSGFMLVLAGSHRDRLSAWAAGTPPARSSPPHRLWSCRAICIH